MIVAGLLHYYGEEARLVIFDSNTLEDSLKCDIESCVNNKNMFLCFRDMEFIKDISLPAVVEGKLEIIENI